MNEIKLPERIRKIINALSDAGYSAYAVGGCVRDSLLGNTPKDFDVTTDALPQEIERVFAQYPVIETGIKHGTVTVIFEGLPVEITTFRVDVDSSDHRHPEQVHFTRSLREDAARRDFTVNALAYNDREGLIDHFGGVKDLQKGILRAVGTPEKRFEEDALRILRVLRFSSVLGFRIESETAAAAFRKKDLLQFVSAERVAAEFTKMLCGKNVREVLLQNYEILGAVLPELLPMAGFDQKNPHHCYDVLEHTTAAVAEVSPEPVLRLAALLHDIGKPECFFTDAEGIGHFYGHAKISARLAERILLRLKYDNLTRRQVLALVEFHNYPIEAEERSVKRALRKFSPELFFALLQLKRADNFAQAPAYHTRRQTYDQIEQLAEKILAEGQCFSLKDLAVNGNDLIALGVRPGREIGIFLQKLLDAVISGEISNEKKVLLQFIKKDSYFKEEST